MHVADALAKLIEQANRVRTGMPGFMVYLDLCFFTVYSSETQSASHFAAQAFARISRTGQFILQSLRNTLRWASEAT